MAKYKIFLSKKYIKDLKLLKKRKDFDVEALAETLLKLSNGEILDKKYKDHKLQNSRNYKNCRECHITNDWLLIYRIDNDNLLLLLLRTGTHSDLF